MRKGVPAAAAARTCVAIELVKSVSEAMGSIVSGYDGSNFDFFERGLFGFLQLRRHVGRVSPQGAIRQARLEAANADVGLRCADPTYREA
jgi:hypothetical protein